MAFENPPSAPDPQPSSILPTVTRFATAGIGIAALYVGYVFYARHSADERAARDLAAKQAAANQHQAALIFGSGEVKITSYSVDKASIARGESADLCYGVVNATKVALDPPVEAAKPSSFHCLTVAPRATTKYTLTASNDKGESTSLSVTVHVH
jgi:hypothetical protein